MESRAINSFRAEVRRRGFRRLNDHELAEVRRKSLTAHYSNLIEGVIPDAETVALFDVLHEERVPAEEWPALVLNAVRARLARKPHAA